MKKKKYQFEPFFPDKPLLTLPCQTFLIQTVQIETNEKNDHRAEKVSTLVLTELRSESVEIDLVIELKFYRP